MFSIIPHALGSLGQQQKRRVSDKKKFLEKQIGGPKMLQTYLYKWMENKQGSSCLWHCIQGKHLQFRNRFKDVMVKFITTCLKLLIRAENFLKFSALFKVLGFPGGTVNKLEEETATHSSILAWRNPRTEEPGRLQSMESQESEMTYRLNHHQHHHHSG